jgi:hypothetical protein
VFWDDLWAQNKTIGKLRACKSGLDPSEKGSMCVMRGRRMRMRMRIR